MRSEVARFAQRDAGSSCAAQALRACAALSLLALSHGQVAHAQLQPAACSTVATLFEQGVATGAACAEQAMAAGFTVLDLSDDWVPRVLSEPPEATGALRQPYRETYIGLANQRLATGEHDAWANNLELLGVFPSFRVIRERLLDEARHACHDAVRDEPLVRLERTLSAWRPDLATQRERLERVRKDAVYLERARKRLQLADIDELANVRGYAYLVKRYHHDRAAVDAISAAQEHLVCSGALTERYERGVLDAATAAALRVLGAEHMTISSGALDAGARALLLTDSRERVFRAALRALRERVSDATGVIEDGSATGRFGQVLGRDLDPPELRAVAAYGPLEGGAEDLVSPLTDAAARALGWTDPGALARFFRAGDPTEGRIAHVGLRLPKPPSYHRPHMELRAEIDRGDVWYAYPYRADGTARRMPVERRPTLVLYARVADGWKPLARYMTTIGGWQREQTPSGVVGLRYKESPVGARTWRDLIAAPVWLPPASTPDSELLRRDPRRGDRAKLELLGPGYRSAYGLAMLVHLQPRGSVARRVEANEQTPDLFVDDACCVDQGVRTHGSVAYASILRGHSHGCHRLFNHLALRLMSFLLAHRNHVRHGSSPVHYDRTLASASERIVVRIRSRGYRYELVPPLPIEVLPGRVRGSVRQPIRALRPLPPRASPAHEPAE